MPLCECGCGGIALQKWIKGHNFVYKNCIGKTPWNKGLTKEKDIRVKKGWCSGLTKDNCLGLMNLSLKKLGNKCGLGHKFIPSEETKRKMSLAVSKNWENIEYRNHMVESHKGKSLTLKHKQAISLGCKGKLRSAEVRQHMSDAQKQSYLRGRELNIGQNPGFVSAELGHYVRSLWEANFARLLKFFDFTYIYEDRRFQLSNGKTYMPDFYIPEIDMFFEIKGNWRGIKKLDKAKLFQEDNLGDLVIIDEPQYDILQKTFKDVILNWGRRI